MIFRIEMASVSCVPTPLETQIFGLYDQRAAIKIKLTGDVLQKVQWVRNKCFEAENQEHGGAQNFRRSRGQAPSATPIASVSSSPATPSTPNSLQSFRSGVCVTNGAQEKNAVVKSGSQVFGKDAGKAWSSGNGTSGNGGNGGNGGHGGNSGHGGSGGNSHGGHSHGGHGHSYGSHGHTRYTSIFKKSTDVNGQILNNLILSKLNKFSTKNYDDVKSFIQQILDSDDKEFVKAFVNLVFNKASQEPSFCALFAKLLGDLTQTYNSVKEEVMVLYEKYMNIFDEVEEKKAAAEAADKDDSIAKNNQLIEYTRDKTYRLGYSQFLSELACLHVITIENLMKLFQKLIDNIYKFGVYEESTGLVDVYTECYLCMIKAFKKSNVAASLHDKRAILRGQYAKKLQEIINNAGEKNRFSGIGFRSKFALMDSLDILEGNDA